MTKIDTSKVNEKEGALTFKIPCDGNLFDSSFENLIICQFHKGKTIFLIERDKDFNLIFIKSNPNYLTKIAKTNIEKFKNNENIRITCLWSIDENKLFVGTSTEDLIQTNSIEDKNIKYRLDKLGNIHKIGDDNVNAQDVQIYSNGEILLEPSAKEIFDFNIEKIDVLFKNIKKGDYLFEQTLSQHILIILATIFEVYMKTRFLELEEENKTVNISKIYKKFVPPNYRDKVISEIKSKSLEKNISELRVFIDDNKFINFQSFDNSKEAYKLGYQINFIDFESNENIQKVRKFLKWRHRIIHSKDSCSVLNIDQVPPEKPISCSENLAREGRDLFYDFIQKLHKETLK